MADLGNISKIQLVNGDVAHFQDLVSGYTKNTGTITGIKMNGSSKGTSGVVDLGTVITAHQDISGKADKSATVSTIAWDSTNSKLTKTINGTTTDVVTIATIKSALALPDPMVFKGSLGTGGTITSLPTASASNKGYTYKVITAGTYASQAAKVGDTFISDGSSWVLIPSGDEPSGTVTSVGIANGGAISVSGSPITSSGTITISHADTSSQASSSNSGRTYIQSVTLDTYGHVTGLTTATETVTDTWRGIQDNLTSSTNTSESLSAKQGYLLANGSARDNTKLPLTGGNVTGAVSFGSSVSMDEATVGDLVVNGAASCTNNLQVNTINGVTVGSSPKFTDTVTTVSTTGDGNAVTAITASGGAVTVTKGTTFLTSHQDISGKADKSATVSTVTYDSTNAKITKTINGTTTDVVTVATLKTALGSMPASDVYSWAKASSKPSYTANEVGALPTGYTYTTSIATSSGTNQLTLAYGTKYALTAGGTSYIFTMPASDNTWRGIQNNLTSDSTTDSLSAAQGKALKAMIDGLPTPMVFKGSLGTGGTITSLPTAAAGNKGYTYKVITAGTYASQSAKIGDTFISDGSSWVLIPSGDEPSGTVTSVGISGGTGISVSGSPITSSGTISLGLKLGYTTSGNNRAVQADSNGNLYVVQKDNNTTYSAGTGLSLSSTTFSVKLGYTTSGNNRAVQADSDGNLYVVQKDDNTWTAMVGATSSANGSVGYVNATPPKDGYNTKYLRADGTWSVPPNTTYSITGSATPSMTTTATKTTLGTAFTVPNVTSVGSASTWVFEEVSIPNVTAAGSASSWTFEEKTIPNVTAVGSGSASLTVSVSNHVLSFSLSHTHTAPTLGTAIKVQSKSGGSNGSAPTLGTAIKVQSKKSGGNGSAPTLGTAFTIPNVTGNTTGSVSGGAHTHSIG